MNLDLMAMLKYITKKTLYFVQWSSDIVDSVDSKTRANIMNETVHPI